MVVELHKGVQRCCLGRRALKNNWLITQIGSICRSQKWKEGTFFQKAFERFYGNKRRGINREAGNAHVRYVQRR